MKSAKETLSPTRVKLTVEVPFEDLKPGIDAAYKAFGSQITVPGFRKGKVPAAVIDQRVGKETVLNEALNNLLPQLYSRALSEAAVVPLSQPEVDIVTLEDGKPLEFTAELDVRPDIELPDLSDLKVEVEAIKIDAAKVDEEIEAVRERFAELKDVDRAAQDGDQVTIDLSASKDGEKIASAQAEGLPYRVGQATMIEGLDEAIIGLAAGESKVFESKLAGGELAGEEVDVEVTVQSVKEPELPELNEEFVQMVSQFDTMEEFRADLEDRLTRIARLDQAAAARDGVLEQILEKIDPPLPENVIAEEVLHRKADIEQQLGFAGMTMDDYLDAEKQTIDEFEADLEKQVREAMVSQFVLDLIVERDSIGVENDELMNHMMRRAQQSGQDPQGYIQHAVEHNHLPELVGEVVRGKALANIVAAATIVDTEGNELDFSKLQGDGSFAEDGDESSAPDEKVQSADSPESADSPDSPESADSPDSPKSAD